MIHSRLHGTLSPAVAALGGGSHVGDDSVMDKRSMGLESLD